MASTPKTASTIDLSKATDAELKNIHSQVLSNLALRANDPSTLADGYDRHGSGHSRSGGSSNLANPVEAQVVKAKSVKAKAVK
ncbi:hypothetical protein SAMN04515617_1418 [Collimonas sp. OK242]|uniref:hypothetical protein n=1 Tax=Collimonas sp. OK242 TaxID=1798195 RepID=UPI000895AE1C|nr:hypothetical protein [Collimonas sp. OK242]SDY98303.1 hypothetical protein SAMN04515617_1418 [Collimonas sp. OK242]